MLQSINHKKYLTHCVLQKREWWKVTKTTETIKLKIKVKKLGKTKKFAGDV